MRVAGSRTFEKGPRLVPGASASRRRCLTVANRQATHLRRICVSANNMASTSALDNEIAELEEKLAQKRVERLNAKTGGTATCPEQLATGLPMSVMTDSYKAAHYAQYPGAKRMVAYGSFRKPFKNKDGEPYDKNDTRLVFYGIRYLVNNYLDRRWTLKDVERAAHFYSTHNAGFKPYPFPLELFKLCVEKHGGFFPVKLEALPEGTVVHAGCPVFQLTTVEPFAHLCTFFETILTHVWYPTTVATLSRRARDAIERGFVESVEGGVASPLLLSRLHDFGFRGVTCVEQSVVGGCAHLLNFEGTDTMSAAYYAQYALNGGKAVATSVPATEHSVMTSWRTEREAILNMIDKFGDGVYAIVMDSYDYANALTKILPSVAAQKVGKGGFLVLRPDSGDPVDAVMQGLRAAEAAFGADVNSLGYKVIRGCSVIQGDGIDIVVLQKIMDAALAEKYSAQCVGFGMGGGLLQKVNRDTMSFATKLCHIEYADGTRSDIMKAPLTDVGKYSLPGILQIKRIKGVPTAFCVPDHGAGKPLVTPEENLLKVVYDNGPVANPGWESFDDLRKRVAAEWKAAPLKADNVSDQLKEVTKVVVAKLHKKATEAMAV